MYVTTREAAHKLGITPQAVRWHISVRNLKARKSKAGQWLVTAASVNKLRAA